MIAQRPPSTLDKSQLDALLGLRVLATFLVVLGHAGSIFSGVDLLRAPVSMNVQSASVTVFFCISGWTIAWVVDRVPRYDALHLSRFLFDRFLRLSIPLVPTLAVFGCLEWWFLGESHPYLKNTGLLPFIGNLLFLQMLPVPILDTIPPFGLNRPLWTISIEFWIYVLYGGLIFFLRAHFNALAAGFCLLGLVLVHPFFLGQRGEGLASVWFLGACCYALRGYVPANVAKATLITSAICLFIPALWPEDGNYSKAFNLNLTLFVSSFVLTSAGLRFTVHRLIRKVSEYCYTIYLTHYPLMVLASLALPQSKGSLAAILFVFVAFVFGYLMSFLGERYYRVLRDWAWAICSRRGVVGKVK